MVLGKKVAIFDWEWTENPQIKQMDEKTMYVLIRWLHQKPADLDLHCFLLLF